MHSKLGLLSLRSWRRFLRLHLLYKTINNIDCPDQLKNYLVKRSDPHKRSVSDISLVDLGETLSSAIEQSSFLYGAAKDWTKGTQLCF